MKKLIFILLVLTGCAKTIYQTDRHLSVPFHPVNVGTTANDGTGDKLRVAWQQYNVTVAAIADSLGNIFTEAQSKADANYQIDTTITAATDISTIAPLWSDTTNTHGGILTYDQGVNLLSGGGGGGGVTGRYGETIGRVGESGMPDAGDSTDYNPEWIGKHLTVIREGADLSQHLDNTVSDGFKFDNTTGIVTFRPVLGANEQLKYYATNTIEYYTIVPAGGGGEAENSLLTGLKAGWKLDEVSGTLVNDVLGVYNGTTSATVNSPGLFGVAESFDGIDDVASFGTSVADFGTSDWSYTCKIYFDNLPSANKGIMGNYNGTSVFWYLRTTAANLLSANVNFDDDPQYMTESNSALSADTWYRVVVTIDRSGNQTMYINNNTPQTDVDDVSSESAVSMNNNAQFNLGNIGGSAATFFGALKIDDVYLYPRLLTADEITNIMAGTFPW